MKRLALCLLLGCATSPTEPVERDASTDAPHPLVELVCGEYACGKQTDKASGVTVDCGSCPIGSECGDNGEEGVCGSACVAFPNEDACNLALGFGWAHDVPSAEYPGTCNYLDQDVCTWIFNEYPADGICAADICGEAYWCCTGTTTLLPGAAADGG
jgi:hypothetical protein